MQNIRMLNESNEHFIDYLSSEFAKEVLAKNKMKIHQDTGNIYYKRAFTRAFTVLCMLKGETKKLMDFELDISEDFEFYLDETIAGITNDKFDIDMHGTSKFLFYYFNNLRCDLREEVYKIRHTTVSDNQHALETLDSKDWPYFINRLLEISGGEITSFNSNRISQNGNDVEELKIISETIESLEICQIYYADVYANVSGSFQKYLKYASDILIEKMEDDLRLNLYSFFDLKNEPNAKEIMHTFDRFFFAFGRFPAINELTVIF